MRDTRLLIAYRFFLRVTPILLLISLLGGAALTRGQVEPSKKDRCPVCGMYVDQYRNWLASIVLKEGRQFFFDGPKDMFRFYLNMSEYEKSATPEDITEIYVTDYYSTKLIDARKAFFVMGSDVRGPMGKELVPIGDKVQAETFLKDHGGERILEFDQVTNAVFPELK